MALFRKYIKYSLRGTQAHQAVRVRYLAYCFPALLLSTTRAPKRGDSAADSSKPRHSPNRPSKAAHGCPGRAVRGRVSIPRC